MKTPFLVTPWNEDFLEALLRRALHDCGEAAGGFGPEGGTMGRGLHRALFIFPHSRPEKYLIRLLQSDPRVPRPLILPQFHTVSGLFSVLRRSMDARPAWNAGLLDRVGLLLDCVRAESAGEKAFFRSKEGSPLQDAHRFFPWGVRLAALFEECFTQRRRPENFLHAEGQVSPFAAHLLERLSGIFARYGEGLREREWTTPGYDAALAVDRLEQESSLPEALFHGRVIYIAGFHALTGTEKALFAHLWREKGARVMLHADPTLVDGHGHWSCSLLLDWTKEWGAPLELWESGFSPSAACIQKNGDATVSSPRMPVAEESASPRIRYCEGFDLHSQLDVLREELADMPEASVSAGESVPTGVSGNASFTRGYAADTAVILPDSGLLMPALHHLPRTDINISMGYPLVRSPLFRLLDTLLRLQENRRGSGYYWRDLVELVRHPYLKMLLVPDDSASGPEAGPNTVTAATSGLPDASNNTPNCGVKGGHPPCGGRGGAPHKQNGFDTQAFPSGQSSDLRRELRRFEQALRTSGSRYHEPFAVLSSLSLALTPEEAPSPALSRMVEELFAVTLSNFENPATPADLGAALETLCAFLLTHGGELWSRFLIDAECLYRLIQSLVPELSRSALAREVFPPATLFSMARRLMEAERVPFEATPLVGLQVMGVLETRLLSFRRVVILDATEDALPGSPAGDPLLPETLRRELGLPDLAAREQVAAYHFFRLLAGAKEVILLWQEGADAPGIQERRKKKSRFVEELLWEEEKRLGRLLVPHGPSGKEGNTGRNSDEAGTPGGQADGPLRVLENVLSPVLRERVGIPVTPQVRALLEERLRRPVSASFLDTYLRCPVRFFHERLAGISPADEVPEHGDPVAVGDLFHMVLQEFYAPLLGRPLDEGKRLPPEMTEELLATFFGHPRYYSLSRSLPADLRAMLAVAAQKRLADYLGNQPPTMALALEQTLSAPFTAGGRMLTLTGKADRIDLRFAQYSGHAEDVGTAGASQAETVPFLAILDYKTGSLPEAGFSFWENPHLWQRMALWQPPGEDPGCEAGASRPCDPVFAELSRSLGSVQLPLYLLLLSLSRKAGTLPEPLGGDVLAGARTPPFPAIVSQGLPLITDAAWVALAESGREYPLFNPALPLQEKVALVEERIPQLIDFLLRHMAGSNFFLPNPGPYCNWCSCVGMCILNATAS